MHSIYLLVFFSTSTIFNQQIPNYQYTVQYFVSLSRQRHGTVQVETPKTYTSHYKLTLPLGPTLHCIISNGL
jgi:hypothetical protein